MESTDLYIKDLLLSFNFSSPETTTLILTIKYLATYTDSSDMGRSTRPNDDGLAYGDYNDADLAYGEYNDDGMAYEEYIDDTPDPERDREQIKSTYTLQPIQIPLCSNLDLTLF
jgi:hypothetical protein